MAIPITTIALGVTALGLLGFGAYEFMKGKGTSKPAGDPAAQGDADGYAAGLKDGKAGVEVLNPTDTSTNPTLKAAASASGDAVAYLEAYGKGYDRGYADGKASVAPVTTPSGGSGTTIKPPPGVTPGKTIYKAQLQTAYETGCSDGATNGYNAGFSGGANNSSPPSSPAASASADAAAAYGASYRQSYKGAYSKGASDRADGKAAPGTPVIDDAGRIVSLGDTLEMRVMGISLGCYGGFESWLELYASSHGAKVAGPADARAKMLAAFTNGCMDGASAGFSDAKERRHYDDVPARSAALSSGNEDAYRAGYGTAYEEGWGNGTIGTMLTPSKAKAIARSCYPRFNVWFETYQRKGPKAAMASMGKCYEGWTPSASMGFFSRRPPRALGDAKKIWPEDFRHAGGRRAGTSFPPASGTSFPPA